MIVRPGSIEDNARYTWHCHGCHMTLAPGTATVECWMYHDSVGFVFCSERCMALHTLVKGSVNG